MAYGSPVSSSLVSGDCILHRDKQFIVFARRAYYSSQRISTGHISNEWGWSIKYEKACPCWIFTTEEEAEPLEQHPVHILKAYPTKHSRKTRSKGKPQPYPGGKKSALLKCSENTNITELQFDVHVWNLLYFLLKVSSILFSFLPLRTYCLYTESPKYWCTQLINTLILISIGSSWSLMFFSPSRWKCVLPASRYQETVRLVPRGPTSEEWCEVWPQTRVSM